MVSISLKSPILTPPRRCWAVRRHRHRFLAAGDDDLGVAGGDLLHAERDGAQARAAQLVEAPGGRLLRACRRRSPPGAPGSGPAPAVSTWPRMTSSTSLASTPARASTSLMATTPSSCAGVLAKAPLKEPTGGARRAGHDDCIGSGHFCLQRWAGSMPEIGIVTAVSCPFRDIESNRKSAQPAQRMRDRRVLRCESSACCAAIPHAAAL